MSRSSGIPSGPWIAYRVGAREALRCRSRSWSPIAARKETLTDDYHRGTPPSRPARGRSTRLSSTASATSSTSTRGTRSARLASCSTSTCTPSTSCSPARARRILPREEFFREWSVDEIYEMVIEGSDTDMIVAQPLPAHRPVPRRAVAVGEVRRDGPEASRQGGLLGLGEPARGQEGDST